MGGKLGVTPRFGKAAEAPNYSRPQGVLRSLPRIRSAARRPGKSLTGSKKPGPIARAFFKGMMEAVVRPDC